MDAERALAEMLVRWEGGVLASQLDMVVRVGDAWSKVETGIARGGAVSQKLTVPSSRGPSRVSALMIIDRFLRVQDMRLLLEHAHELSSAVSATLATSFSTQVSSKRSLPAFNAGRVSSLTTFPCL